MALVDPTRMALERLQCRSSKESLAGRRGYSCRDTSEAVPHGSLENQIVTSRKLCIELISLFWSKTIQNRMAKPQHLDGSAPGKVITTYAHSASFHFGPLAIPVVRNKGKR
jgi:hypothetical protein